MADILSYHNNTKAKERWSNMERVKLVEQMLANPPEPNEALRELLRSPDPWDNAPCELNYDHQGGDVA